MKNTTNHGLHKPEPQTDNVNIDVLNENMDIVDKGLVIYLGTTSGSANAYTIASDYIKELSEGLAVCIKIHTASTAASTLNINGWGATAIKKAGGSDATNLKAGIYTLRYDGANFILQGEGASGDAAASDLLLGKKATTDAGDIVGTMPDNSGNTVSAPTAAVTGQSTGIVDVSVPSTGKFSTSSKLRIYDPDFIAANFREGSEAFGLVGTAKVADPCAQISSLTGVFGSSVQGRVELSWDVPADGKIKGLIIQYKTDSYPTGPTDGNLLYDTNDVLPIPSSYVGALAEGVTYYFRAFAYTYQNATRLYTTSTAGAQVTGVPHRLQGVQVFTTSETFTVPFGVNSIDIFCVGAGSGGNTGGTSGSAGGGGGGGGYTAKKKAYAVTPGQQFAIVIGAGGVGGGPSAAAGKAGGATSFGGTVLVANGGAAPATLYGGLNGGSGGGAYIPSGTGGTGGTDGSSGYGGGGNSGGTGQGSTTKAFGEPTGTLYSGGGGGFPGGTGGAGGGAAAGTGGGGGYSASPNTGGGGGGGWATTNGGNGGSGICIVRWGY